MIRLETTCYYKLHKFKKSRVPNAQNDERRTELATFCPYMPLDIGTLYKGIQPLSGQYMLGDVINHQNIL